MEIPVADMADDGCRNERGREYLLRLSNAFGEPRDRHAESVAASSFRHPSSAMSATGISISRWSSSRPILRKWRRSSGSTTGWSSGRWPWNGTCTGEHGIGYGKMDFLIAEHGEAVSVMRAISRRSIRTIS